MESVRLLGSRWTRRRLLTATAVAGGALGFGAAPWTGPVLPAAAQEPPKRGGTIIVNSRHQAGLFNSLDPLRSGEGANGEVQAPIHDALVRAAADGRSLEPSLAERWEVSPDGLTYVFHLRDALFHDGSPVTAEDVVFSLERSRTTEGSYLQTAMPPATITASDPKTVTIALERLWAPFLVVLTFGEAWVLPKALVETQKTLFFQHPIGAGPFKLVSWAADGPFVYARHDGYWETDKPYLDGFTMRYITAPDDVATLFERSELDIAFMIPIAQVPRFQAMPNAELRQDPSGAMAFGVINVDRPPFDDKLLRQAMNYAVDKDAIIQAALGGYGQPQNTYIPKIAGHDDANPGFPFDLAKARELVAQSAGKDGFTVELVTFPQDPNRDAVVPLLTEQLAQIGGTVTRTPDNEFDARMGAGNFDLMLTGAGGGLDPDDMAIIARSDGAKFVGSTYSNPRVDEVLHAAADTTDWDARIRLYQQAQTLVNEDAPFLYLFYADVVSATNRHIHGFAVGPGLGYAPSAIWRDDA